MLNFKKLLLETVKKVSDFFNKNHNTHLGNDFKNVHEKLHEIQGFNRNVGKTAALHDHEVKALRSYANESNHVNVGLLNGNGSVEKAHAYQHKNGDGEIVNVPDLDSAINKHKLPAMSVHAGIGFNPKKETQKTGGVFKTPAYTSTSIHPEDARYFARPQYKDDDTFDRHVLNIHVPEGHSGIYLGNQKHGSKITMSDEHEVLLPRGLTMKIGDKPKHTMVDPSNNDHYHVWDAHIVPHGEDPHTYNPKKADK